MTFTLKHPALPSSLLFFSGVALFFIKPIAQPSDYHQFADESLHFGIAHFWDVASNIGFLIAALIGALVMRQERKNPSFVRSFSGYRLFLIGLFCTAFGSAWYHLNPTNESLIWDRLPIAWLCAGLLAGVYADTHHKSVRKLTFWLAIYATLSVAWWYGSELFGAGDLRFYLVLQALPMVLIPLWQWIYDTPAKERLLFAAALVFYALAKVAEMEDHSLAAFFQTTALPELTGHTLKHLSASVSALFIVAALALRKGTKQKV